MKPSIVFIGHSIEDSEEAKRLEHAVAALGLSPLREEDFNPAREGWEDSIQDGVLRSDMVLLVWSRHAAGSKVVEFESSAALDSGKTVILCPIDSTPPDPRLSSSKIIPIRDYAKAIPSLLGAIGNSGSEGSESSMTRMPVRPADPGTLEAETMAAAGMVLPAGPTQVQTSAVSSSDVAGAFRSSSDLVGQQIGERYRVVRLLGRGGMGAVYQVHDNELDRDVALKVIRTDLAEDPSVLWRFKREIQLSSAITHKNVLRVFDLGEAGGVKFLTMQYVAGGDLAGLLKTEGKLPVPRLIHLFRQICEGLEAAHEHGIMHRDLKPSNIMIDAEDRVFLTDFGLAKSVVNTGMTQVGFVLGTPHYMSPEQVRGEKADLQSDIYSLGVILYEMATGALPFGGDSIYEVMMQRVQKPPKPPSEVNPEIPPFLEKIIKRCMALEKTARYQTIRELISDIDQGIETGRTSAAAKFIIRSWLASAASVPRSKVAYASAVALLLALTSWWFFQRSGPSPAPAAHKPISVLISDFKNQTGNPLFDDTLEQTLSTGLEGASFITTYNRGTARKIAGQLNPGATSLNESLARLVAAREGIDVIIDGTISEGNGYRISISAVDALTGKPLDGESAQASGKQEVLTTLVRLSARIRKALGDTTPESVQMAAAETFTTSSLEAAKNYAVAQELQGTGQWEKAVPFYSRAVELDPNMGRAYAGLAVMYRNLGNRKEAERYYQMAMARIDRMTERERYRTLGGYFVTMGNQQKAIEEYQALVQQYPADFVGYSNLALADFLSRNMQEALAEGRRATEIYPKNVVMRSNLALYAMYAGDFAAAEREAKEILKLDRSYGSVYVCLALSDLAQDKYQEGADAYRQLQGLDASSASSAAAGLADMAIYQGRMKEAATILQKGIAQDQARKDAFMAARKETTLAAVLLALGQTREALGEVSRAVEASTQASVLLEAARVYIDAKQFDSALKLASELGQQLEVEPRLYAKLIEGECQVAKSNTWDAIRTFHDAQKLSDAWLVRFDLGRAYLDASAFTEAYAEFEQCIKRRGEASAVFLDDIPTLHYLPSVYYYLGRAQQGLGSPAAADSYRTYLKIKSQASGDLMVRDAQLRLAVF